MESKRIFLSSPTMNGREMGYIQEAFDTNWIAPLGKNVDGFECELGEYLKSHQGEQRQGEEYHLAALSSGTAAIHLALKLAGVQEGDKVFCSSLTFAASANPICYEKAVPVFIESERDSWNMSPDSLREAFHRYPECRIVICANLYGTPAKLSEIREICKENHAILIEDAAESLGAVYKGRQTGTYGDFGVFSFNGNKMITTSGGGMLLCHTKEAASKARFYATQAREPARHYEHKEIGYNYRMSNIVAGIGRGQLWSLDEYIERKQRIYETYEEAFRDIPGISLNPVPEGAKANHWLSCILLKPGCGVTPNQIMDALEAENIESRPIWKPMHLQPVFSDCAYVHTGDPVSEEIFRNGVCLPSDIKNTEEDMERIIRIIKGLFF
ncbi:MAG: aminotransferase class I/II-fold pyridoxal phosphate-dependent enzyme [Clostridiales bacterium]|nr:aminotransferase class I/II-fold pyridoxal phosphate-dependent enzyme [Clostridiales bacterium]